LPVFVSRTGFEGYPPWSETLNLIKPIYLNSQSFARKGILGRKKKVEQRKHKKLLSSPASSQLERRMKSRQKF
jgi:hypothetical protein